MTEEGKQIYNYYLRALRVNNDKPFRPKKDFTDFEKKEEYIYILKLEQFFKKFPHLFKYDFFNAPYRLYNKDEQKYFSLKYFSSPKGLRTCIDYYQSLLKDSPDDQIDFIKESLKFIANFCVEKKISFEDYPYYKSVSQPDFLKHLKEHRVSWYIIFAIPAMLDHIHKMDMDEFELYFGDMINISELQMNYSGSKMAKEIIKKTIKKLSEIVGKSLKISGKGGKIG